MTSPCSSCTTPDLCQGDCIRKRGLRQTFQYRKPDEELFDDRPGRRSDLVRWAKEAFWFAFLGCAALGALTAAYLAYRAAVAVWAWI